MKNLNLTMAIIYTAIYSLMVLVSLMDKDNEMLLGTIILSGPVVTNWITYNNLNK